MKGAAIWGYDCQMAAEMPCCVPCQSNGAACGVLSFIFFRGASPLWTDTSASATFQELNKKENQQEKSYY